MITVNEDKSIYLTRGDVGAFSVTADINGEGYTFQPGEIIRFNVFEKKNCEKVVIYKTVPVLEASEEVQIVLTESETRIGETISKPTDYWYEIELVDINGKVQTIVGYDEDGAKILRLFPEAKAEKAPIIPEDVPIIDSELDVTSHRPIENQAVARAIIELRELIKNNTE